MDKRLIEGRIPKLLFSLAMPAICAQLITLVYNLVDRIYIGRLPDGAPIMAAIGVCAPVVTVIQAFTGMFGRGGSPLAAIQMGRGDHDRAERYLGASLTMLAATSVLITAGVLAFKRPLLLLFGASDETLAFAENYIGIYILGTLFMQVTVGLNYYITTQGFAGTAMLTTALGGVLNIILDPIFIFLLHMNERGAALATVISQGASFVWVLCFMFGKKNRLRIRPMNLLPGLRTLKDIVVLGSAPFFMNASEGLLTICFNRQALHYGGYVAVSALTICFSIFEFMLMPVEGVAQGSQPIIGHNYGAGRTDRVRETIRLASAVTLGFTMLATTVVMLFPEVFIRIFNDDPGLVSLGGRMLRIYVGGLFVLGLNSTCQQTYNSLGEGGRAFFFAFFRKMVLLIPLLYILPAVTPWGLMSVVLAEPVSDLITTAANTAYFFGRFVKKKLA